MNFRSEYLNQEVECSEFIDGNETVTIIPHETLERCVYNSPKCLENGVTVGYTPICVEPLHYAVLCRISDKNGRNVECVGESIETTLKTEIARQYPVLMAVKRAFDDAAIKFLQFPNKAYSDQQIAVSGLKEVGVSAPAAAPAKPAEVPAEAQPPVQTEEVIGPAAFDKPLTFGQNRGKTLNELWPDNVESIKWIANTLRPTREETIYWQKVAKKFLEAKGV